MGDLRSKNPHAVELCGALPKSVRRDKTFNQPRSRSVCPRKSPQFQSFRRAFFKRPRSPRSSTRIPAYSKRPRVLLTHAEAREDTVYYVLGHGSAVHRAERGQGELEIGACDILGHSDSERGERFVDVMHSSADIRILTGV